MEKTPSMKDAVIEFASVKERSNNESGDSSPSAEVLLVCSPGGHLLQLLALRPAWADLARVWVTLESSDSRSLLKGERVVYAHGPAFRNAKNLLRNLWVAWRMIREVKPAVVLTTGAALAVPFAWVAHVCGVKVVYVESFTRVHEPSLSCRLVKPVVDRLYVQWPDLLRALPSARYVGSAFTNP
jgi:beta-1,4-N-acetylglucosaminyltransferase